MSEPNWQTLVLAHLTGEAPDHLEPDDLTNPERWRHAYATLMSMRGQADPPELLADLDRRVTDLDQHLDSYYKSFNLLFESQIEQMQKLRERQDFLEMMARLGDATKGEGR